MNGKLHKFYLIKPKPNLNTTEICEGLLALRPVREVIITGGDYGYMVKARFRDNKEPRDLEKYLSKNLGSRFGKVQAYARYMK